MKQLILKGNIAYSDQEHHLKCMEQSYLVCENNRVIGVYRELPQEYINWQLNDYGDCLIVPGMTDLHVHAPQYSYRGTGMDLELLDWLQRYTFPEEAKYFDNNYAKNAYQIFTDDLKTSYTTRACVFATIHNEATLTLMDQLEDSGLVTYVGRVNMDRNGGKNYCEESAQQSLKETESWVLESQSRYERTKPILTPRFIPCCTDELMTGLSELQRQYGVRVQSHLSENLSEIAWVKELVPQSSCYGEAYDMFGMFGNEEYPAVMAHCVYSSQEEIELMKKQHVYIAHSPESNLNVSSGIAPIRKYLDQGLHIGLATDVAGGSSISMLKAMSLAVQSSKMYWRLVDQTVRPLDFSEVFYLATAGGGSYFGKAGSFLPDYEFDAVVIDDSRVRSTRKLELKDRLERMIYQTESLQITAKFVAGKQII